MRQEDTAAPVDPEWLATGRGLSGRRWGIVIIGRMLEWKPPDPRIVDLVRRIQNAARRRLRPAPRRPESLRVIDEKNAPTAGQDDSPHPRR